MGGLPGEMLAGTKADLQPDLAGLREEGDPVLVKHAQIGERKLRGEGMSLRGVDYVQYLTPIITIDEYLRFATRLILAFGIIFEMPVVLVLLSFMGIVTPAGLRKYQRHALVTLALISALLTPADLGTMFMLLVPMVLLYELSIWLVGGEEADAVAEMDSFASEEATEEGGDDWGGGEEAEAEKAAGEAAGDELVTDLKALKRWVAEADRHGIDMVVDDEFGRLSDDDRARELMEMLLDAGGSFAPWRDWKAPNAAARYWPKMIEMFDKLGDRELELPAQVNLARRFYAPILLEKYDNPVPRNRDLEQVEQILVKGLHAEPVGLGHDFLDVRNIAFEDEICDQRRIQHDLHRGDAPDAALPRYQPLRDEAAGIERQVHQQLLPALFREEIDDAVQRLVRAVRVQRREAQVPRFGELDRVLDRVAIADLADQDHVRRLAQGVLQCVVPGLGVDADFALRNDAAFMGVHVLDRILD